MRRAAKMRLRDRMKEDIRRLLDDVSQGAEQGSQLKLPDAPFPLIPSYSLSFLF